MTSADAPGTAARLELSSLESARQAAVEATRRPKWLSILFCVTIGVAFGFALLRSPWGWTVGITVFVLGCVVFLVLDARFKRRSGRLMNLGAGGAARFLAVYGAAFVIGQIGVPGGWQPWFSIAAGALIALMGYVYLRWDEDATAKRLAAGDFDPNDLMP
ncbi:MAG: hypothetical protein Q4P15_06040 [Propionibacteriaceae bacterium]|nr:hypothetical protein [Propionibacteriaceae bacterium]